MKVVRLWIVEITLRLLMAVMTAAGTLGKISTVYVFASVALIDLSCSIRCLKKIITYFRLVPVITTVTVAQPRLTLAT
jgi:hypothetical protein